MPMSRGEDSHVRFMPSAGVEWHFFRAVGPLLRELHRYRSITQGGSLP